MKDSRSTAPRRLLKKLVQGWSTMGRDAKARAVCALIDQHGYSRCEIARELGLSEFAVRHVYIRRRGRGPGTACTAASPEGAEPPLSAERKQIGAAEKAKSVFLKGKKGNKYVGWERGQTRIIVEALFQVKARLRKKTAVVAARDEIRALVDDAKQHARIYLPFNYNRARSGNMLEISIPDLHVAKYAWARGPAGRTTTCALPSRSLTKPWKLWSRARPATSLTRSISSSATISITPTTSPT